MQVLGGHLGQKINVRKGPVLDFSSVSMCWGVFLKYEQTKTKGGERKLCEAKKSITERKEKSPYAFGFVLSPVQVGTKSINPTSPFHIQIQSLLFLFPADLYSVCKFMLLPSLLFPLFLNKRNMYCLTNQMKI